MEHLDRLLHLIKTGEIERMQLDETQRTTLDELLIYGLLIKSEEKIKLSPRGMQASREGTALFLKRERVAAEMMFNKRSRQRSKRNFLISLTSLIIVVFLLIGLLLQQNFLF